MTHTVHGPIELFKGHREKMPSRRAGWKQRAEILDAHGMSQVFYVQFGEYPDGRLGEVFIDASKEGTFTRGILGTLGRVISVALQCGTPVSEIIKAMRHLNFPPNGAVCTDASGVDHEGSGVQACTSVVDWIAQEIDNAYTAVERSDPATDPIPDHVPGPTDANGEGSTV